MSTASPDAREITRAAKSNLALAFIALPPERREDITIFYAWCRVIDDVGDEPGQTVSERRSALARWSQALETEIPGEAPLAACVRGLIGRYRLSVELFREVIAGVEMDLDAISYQTWDDLRVYCYRVASAVGLISIEIFGCRTEAAKEYAIELGLALQLTNILRDVGEDWGNGGRVYLPRADLAQFGYTLDDLAAGRRNDAFQALMNFEAQRAREYYARAMAVFPSADKKALVAAEIMRGVYSRLLSKLERSRFDIFGRRCRLSRLEKLAIIIGTILRTKFG